MRAGIVLRHTANMQVVVGTTNASRIPGIVKAAEITLTREEWYELYAAAGNKPVSYTHLYELHCVWYKKRLVRVGAVH